MKVSLDDARFQIVAWFCEMKILVQNEVFSRSGLQ
jgi:hypothetical protein